MPPDLLRPRSVAPAGLGVLGIVSDIVAVVPLKVIGTGTSTLTRIWQDGAAEGGWTG